MYECWIVDVDKHGNKKLLMKCNGFPGCDPSSLIKYNNLDGKK